jgi:proline dehydrogenase
MINQLLANALPYMPKKLIWIFSKRYIAGETIEDAIKVCRQLNQDPTGGRE